MQVLAQSYFCEQLNSLPKRFLINKNKMKTCKQTLSKTVRARVSVSVSLSVCVYVWVSVERVNCRLPQLIDFCAISALGQ
jgi:hypothetical protein